MKMKVLIRHIPFGEEGALLCEPWSAPAIGLDNLPRKDDRFKLKNRIFTVSAIEWLYTEKEVHIIAMEYQGAMREADRNPPDNAGTG